MRLFLPPGLALLLAACAGAAGPTAVEAPAVPFARAFQLVFGQQVRLDDTDIHARFAELLEESRCPLGVQCVQAGRARVRLEVTRGDAVPVAVELGTDPDRAQATGGGVLWELHRVDPAPVGGQPRRPEDYVLTLVVRPQPSP